MRIATSKLATLAFLIACAAAAVVLSLTALAARGQALGLADLQGEDRPRQAAMAAYAGGEAPSRDDYGAVDVLAADGALAQAQGPWMSIQPTRTVVTVGQSFTVAVAVKDAPEIAGYMFKIDWNPAVLSFTTAADAGFLSSTPNFPYGPYITTNTVSFGAAQFPPPADLSSGDGTLAIVELQATGVGTSTLDLYSTRLFTATPPQLWILEPGDGMVESICEAAEIVDLAADSLVDLGQEAHFTATVSGTQPITYTWDFDSDGSAERIGAGLDTVTHLYPVWGVYTATLTVDNACDVEDSETVSVTVGGPCDPVAITDLTSDSPVKIGEAMHFTATVTGTMPYSYTWDFGDGGAGEGTGLDTATPTWTYVETGGYTVTFGVDNLCGDDVKTEGVSVEPQAIFLPVIKRNHP